LGLANDAVDRLTILINDLLDISRVESGRLRIQPTEINPVEIVAKAVQTHQGAAEKRGLKLVLENLKAVIEASGMTMKMS
jgi:signal transduction histidine kinase